MGLQDENRESFDDALAKANELERNKKETTPPPLDLAAIEGMEIDELRTLCKRMACQCGLFARMTQEETAQAMLDTLAETALKPIVMGLNVKADIQSRVAAIDKWLDRTKGKPAQYIEQKSFVAVMALDERKIEAKREAENLLNLLSKCDNV